MAPCCSGIDSCVRNPPLHYLFGSQCISSVVFVSRIAPHLLVYVAEAVTAFSEQVLNVNEPPLEVLLSSYSVLENTPPGVLVAELSATDNDGTILGHAVVCSKCFAMWAMNFA